MEQINHYHCTVVLVCLMKLDSVTLEVTEEDSPLIFCAVCEFYVSLTEADIYFRSPSSEEDKHCFGYFSFC